MKQHIIRNRIKCVHCGDVLVSKHRHDFKTCKCGKVSVDGGLDYLKRTFDERFDFWELSELIDYEDDYTIVENALRQKEFKSNCNFCNSDKVLLYKGNGKYIYGLDFLGYKCDECKKIYIFSDIKFIYQSRVFVIADTHFSHTNIIKYSNRPFNNVEEMNETIIKNWNSVVGKEDIVYHLGDFTIDNDNIKNIVNKLNGIIFLIRGNHDGKSIKFYDEVGLDILPTKTIINKKYILSHRPLEDNEIPKGLINLHGHIHNSNLDERFNKDIHQCVSVEKIDYKPRIIS